MPLIQKDFPMDNAFNVINHNFVYYAVVFYTWDFNYRFNLTTIFPK